MKLVKDIQETKISDKNLVLTIGSFDGVHLGHVEILKEVVSLANSHKGTPCVMVLRPHPRTYFSPDAPLNILTCEEKQQSLFKEIGVKITAILPFNQETANLSPEQFITKILLNFEGLRFILVGHDFRFGKGAKGDFKLLKDFGKKYKFEVKQFPPLIIQGERVSSSLIRELVLEGEMEKVVQFLGRRYSILGRVIPGRGIGKQLGFPTANILPFHNAIPPHGVYSAECILEDGRVLPTAVNIGIAPTIRQQDFAIEAHILDFDEQILGQNVELIFHKHLRPEKKFSSREELIHAIGEDINTIKQYFDEYYKNVVNKTITCIK
ncbi:MAG TPA: bifunctional riboflavin kinase/FAD synthetase [Candidatus Hydrogenedens sp.]|nr:bifunctional riboflavin kinase/FAD synthetase [Candidatus Hydrogenedens sp.]